MFAMSAVLLISCDKEETTADSSFAIKASGADYSACSLPVTTVDGDVTVISTNTTWDNDHVWSIKGVVRVTNGATLTIEHGTYIKGDPTHAAPTGVLVITKTGKINALGGIDANANGRIDDSEVKDPIVFTSYRLLDCTAGTAPVPGDFGGVVFLGNAPVNTGSVTNVIEGLGDQSPIGDFQYGGTASNHDVGSFQYVRIEYAGRALAPNVEINGLTMGGVGNAGLTAANTKIHHIQVTYGLDDAYEWFGGTVNANNLIAFAQDDDAFDFDLGYVGTIDFALALADTNSTHSGTPPTSPDSNGIELDNDATGSANTPFTRPLINHLSIIGAGTAALAKSYENGIHIRRNGRITLLNSTVAGYGTNATTTTPVTPDTWAIRFESPSVNTNSLFTNVGVHSYRTGTDAAGQFTTPGTITGVTAATGPNFGMAQPFFNSGFNPAGATNGAFAAGVTWISSDWTKFSAF